MYHSFLQDREYIIPILKNVGYIPLRRITEIYSFPTNNDVHSMSNFYTQRLCKYLGKCLQFKRIKCLL